MGTPWDARTYDQTSAPQQAWASEVLARLEGIAPDATVLDVGCGTGRVTEALLALVPEGRVLAIDASEDMVGLARRRLGEHAKPSASVAPTRAGRSKLLVADRDIRVLDARTGELIRRLTLDPSRDYQPIGGG